jgi:cyanate permease
MLSQAKGMSAAEATQMASIGAAVLAVLTIIGNLAVPAFAERIGRRWTLALYFVCMLLGIVLAFQWAFYLKDGLVPFVLCMVLLGFASGNFAIYNLWLPELYTTQVRATAFAFAISFGRFIAAGVNFLLGALIRDMGTIGTPIALTAIAFGIGLLILPWSIETKGQRLPD